MNKNTLFLDETEEIISLDEIKAHFDNGMTAEEKAEYNNDFNEYIVCCMYWSGKNKADTEVLKL